jgi:hypothetical protein
MRIAIVRHADTGSILCRKYAVSPLGRTHHLLSGLADAFMNLVANISSLSDSLGVPIEELPESIKSSKELLVLILQSKIDS